VNLDGLVLLQALEPLRVGLAMLWILRVAWDVVVFVMPSVMLLHLYQRDQIA